MDRGKVEEIRGVVREARNALGALVYGGQSGDVPVALMASAGQSYYGLSVATEQLEKLLGLLGDEGVTRPGVIQIEAQPVVERDAPVRRSSAEVAASRKRGSAKSAAVRKEQAESKRLGAGRGVLKAAVLDAFNEHPGMELKLAEVCVWLMKHRRDAVSHLAKPSSAVYQCLQKLTEAGRLERSAQGKHQVWSES